MKINYEIDREEYDKFKEENILIELSHKIKKRNFKN